MFLFPKTLTTGHSYLKIQQEPLRVVPAAEIFFWTLNNPAIQQLIC